MNKRIAIAGLAAVAGGAFTVAPALAVEGGDWLLRGRILHVAPDDSSGEIQGLTPAGGRVDVDDETTLELDITYMFTRNIGLELILASPKHDLRGAGAIAGAGKIGEVRLLPPVLSLQYHFTGIDWVRPYVGVGVNYTRFFDEKAVGALEGADLDLDSSWGLAGQVGADFPINPDWFVNVDVKYVQIDTTATVNGATVDVDINPWLLGLGIGRRF